MIRLFFLCLLFMPAVTYGQGDVRNVGSATVLRGTVMVYHVWIDGGDSRWSETEQAAVYQKVNTSLKFLEQWAAAYNVRIRFFQHSYGLNVTGRVPGFGSDSNWVPASLRMLFNNPDEFTQRTRRISRVDHVVYVVHVNKRGRSFARPYYAGRDANRWSEACVVYTGYYKGGDGFASSYAHEILHLFGATDLYFPFDSTDKRKRIAKAVFPNDVMFAAKKDMAQLTVGEWTAYRVGWVDNLQGDYAVFEP